MKRDFLGIFKPKGGGSGDYRDQVKLFRLSTLSTVQYNDSIKVTEDDFLV